ncbi:MAG TPA: bifunctional acetate--CoA ligase family protein/GNAT family N-acetyltransferase [Myxococcales bacterium]|nr:bifunctional acetate--CoA ligase family protein/GNAT family N-acetyltransferase [Myxococcales bacterium]
MAQPIREPKSDASSSLLSAETRHPLHSFFAPRGVAVIGATEREGSVGRTLLWNLVTNPFGGTVYPVNSRRPSVLGIKCYPDVAAVPEPVDLAMVVTPAPTVPGVIRECAAAGIRSAVVISAGFKEIGAEGVRLEQEILAIARESGMRLIGPNCLGVMSPISGLNATFAGAMARKGNVAFLSQSGALQTAILDWSLQENVGFSAFVSLGSMLDVGWGDLIDYLDSDGHTRSILIYMESIGDARTFLSAAREVALRKPIIVLKGGRTTQAAQAAASHTGTLAGSDEVLTAAFRRSGVLRVDSIADLFYMADALAKQPRPRGRRLGIVTNAGGPAVLATDALIIGGGELAPIAPSAMEKLNAFLPAQWSHANPIDVLGDADPERYAKTLEIAGDEKDSDGLLVILTPQDMTEPTLTAERLKPYAHRRADKPVLASWMGGLEVAAGRQALSDAGIPTFRFPDTAVRIFNYMWKYTYNLRGLYETPTLLDEAAGAHGMAADILAQAQREGRTLLTEHESKQVLEAYGISSVETRLASSAEQAAAEAQRLGYPVVVKLHSRTITHKSDVGGVVLDLRSADAVRAAFASIRGRVQPQDFEGVTVQRMAPAGYELIVGSSIDPQFGPVLLFGAGGVLVEVIRDRSLALPPLNTTLARRMMEQTKIYAVLRGVRGRKPVDLEALEKLLVRFSQLVAEQRAIREIDINPLLATADGLFALDARMVLHAEGEKPAPLAVCPYPLRFVGKARMKNGAEVVIRPIRPEDEPKMVDFHKTLSDESVYYRYAGTLKLDMRVAHERLARLCFIDYDREMALIAELSGKLVAVARLTRLVGTRDGEFALLVSDNLQGQGLGRALLSRLFDVGRDWNLERIVAYILPGNVPMRRVCEHLGFTFHGETEAVKVL